MEEGLSKNLLSNQFISPLHHEQTSPHFVGIIKRFYIAHLFEDSWPFNSKVHSVESTDSSHILRSQRSHLIHVGKRKSFCPLPPPPFRLSFTFGPPIFTLTFGVGSCSVISLSSPASLIFFCWLIWEQGNTEGRKQQCRYIRISIKCMDILPHSAPCT